ncbi:MAG: Aspartyl-tRNA synthetase [Candidatus Roizmanbacteria bacterium GW2011_GWA2_36_23]|uniref:Aspartyl-tRNA synthetase n=1 Tax=Candidatus Roizmanbacteria bacterium GW2011_GWA2_36_23 TaxID=1618480 RepID=A0A0G0GQK0_9BACT|nr:MAG: Aspartyl-tRNA synthetase [Candidatus Roizmanbacteria bacterium GW2011_GWA2_36_23]
MKQFFIEQTTDKIGQEVELLGWVNSKRIHKNIVFLDLRDRSGIIQIVGDKSLSDLMPEDIIKISGTVKKREEKVVNPRLTTGKIEIEVKKITRLVKSTELPFDISKENLDLSLPVLLDHRPLTLRHPKIKTIFRVQETIIQTFRSTMKALDFVEFQAPTIVATATEGGAEVFPVKYFGHQAYLAQSPQFYKQIMVSIFEKVYTVAHAYRAEPSVTTRHLTEYVGLDVEMGFIQSWTEIMDTAEYLLKSIFNAVNTEHKKDLKLFNALIPNIPDSKIPRIKLQQAKQIIFETTGRDIRTEPDLDPQGEKDIWQWAKKEHNSDLVFVTHYPTKKRPMYTHPDPDMPDETLSFDLIGMGQEWITGGQRINDYKQLISNMEKWKCDPKDFETPYLQAFKYGMPPEGGFCLGLERITMNILGLANIRQATLFPRDIERIDVRLSTLQKGSKVNQTTNQQSVFDKIEKLLNNNNIAYEVSKHKPVFTSEEAAKARGTELKEGAKALVMFADKKPVMIVLTADKKADTKKLKSEYKFKDLRMATPEEVRIVTGVGIGAVPPFGNLFGIPLYVDSLLKENKKVSFNAGEHTKSITLSSQDYLRVAEATIGKFSAA